MASYSDILFGKIALANRLVTSAQLQQVLAFPSRGALADVLVQRGMLTREQAQRVQRAQALTQFMRAEKIYARILVDRRLVDVAVLRECFARQEQTQHRVRIAQVLMERRLLTAEQNEEVVEEQLVRLAEETARIEEAGLTEMAESDDLNQEIEDLSKARAAGDLEGSTFQRALGPRGLLDGSGGAHGANAAEPRGLRAQVAEAPVSARSPMPADRAPAGAAAAKSSDPLVGKTIASRYRVLEKVGEGGMGTVYKAEHCLMEKIVALKVLNPSLISSKQSLERFRREIRAASKFQHKNVIQIYDAGEGENGLFYMAMEFAAGETLEDVLKRHGALPIERCVRLLRQALGAIGEAHKKGIVHRDLKSGNIMIVVGKDGDEIVKVMDFGIAKIALESAEGLTESGGGGLYKTQEGVVTGTPQYMSPEQCSGEPVDGRADLYSLGVILFEILTGELPFKSNTPMGFLGKHIVEPPPPPSTLRHGLPQVLEDVTLRLLEKKPEARFQSAEEVLAVLDAGRISAAPRAERAASDRHAPQERNRAVPRPTIAAPGPALGLGLTVEVEAPVVEPQAFAPVSTMAAAPPLAPPGAVAPGSKGSRVLIVVLALLLLLVATVSTTVALVLGGSSDDGKNDALVEAKELAALVQRADDLAGRWRQTKTIDDAAAAIAAYEAALVRKDDPQVRARLDQLRVEQKTPATDTEVRPPPVTEKPPPSTEKPPPPATEVKPPPVDPLAAARAVLGKLELALRAGKLDEAATHLAEAEELFPPDHTDLELARRSLGSAQNVEASRAARKDGDLARAKSLMEEAVRQQPDRQQQAQLKRELDELVREAAAQASQAQKLELEAARDKALEESLQAALTLDLDAARAGLERAREAARTLGDDPRLRARARGLELLAGVVGQLRAADEQLRALTNPPAGGEPITAARAQAVLTRLEELRTGLAAMSADEPLATGLHRRLTESLARAERVLADVQQPVATQDDRVTRFVRMVARVRELPEQRETRAMVQDRLEKLQQLVEHPVYQGRKCAPEDKAWIDERLAHFTARLEVWEDLGPRMVSVPGGAWRSPGGVAHELPAIYYAGEAEVTCAEWDEFLRATSRARPRDFPGPTDDPVRMISMADVQAYCTWRSRRPDGKARRVEFRLPTDGEWERAARAAAGTEYPWGANFEDWRENYAAVKGVISRVRAFQKDKNEWGLFDLVGNVQEMTSTRRDGRLVVKGGSIATTRAAAGASAVALVRPGDEASPTIGFRVFAVERPR